jgi:hypothetical protein
MGNAIWYIGLAAISVGIAAYTIIMKRHLCKISTFLVFYLFSASITWFGEFVVLGLFNSYAYKTDLLKDPWAQNLIGHLFLNTSMFPAAAIVMAAYSLEYVGIALIATIFLIPEFIFVKLGLYEQHWWKYYMSFINAVVFLLITKKWFYKMNEKRYGLTRATIFYFVAFLLIHLSSPILLLLGKQNYQYGLINKLVGDFYLSSIIVAFIHHIIFCFILVFFVCILNKWYWKIAPFLISITCLSLYKKFNLLVIDDSWKLIYYIIIQQIFIGIFMLIEKYTLNPNEKCLK